MPGRAIPVFDLYGDPLREPVLGFLHVERIRTRARQHDWAIRAHRHSDLSQAFLVTSGGGRLQIETRAIDFTAPWVLWIPETTVHGFRFEPETDGHVVTVARDLLDETLTRTAAVDLRGVAPSLVSCPLAPDQARRLEDHFDAIQDEAGRGGVAARAAAAARLDLILVELARIRRPDPAPGPHGRSAQLYRRFRTRVEERFRTHESLADYAAALGITTDRLTDICIRAAGRPPKDLLHERLILEAKRDLVYTGMGVAEIGFGLGFKDPAYFSRFFTRRVGRSPASFRRDPEGRPEGRLLRE